MKMSAPATCTFPEPRLHVGLKILQIHVFVMKKEVQHMQDNNSGVSEFSRARYGDAFTGCFTCLQKQH